MLNLPNVGDRVRLLFMPEDPDPITPGSLGTVVTVVPLWHEQHQVAVKWDDGRTLALISGFDQFEIIKV